MARQNGRGVWLYNPLLATARFLRFFLFSDELPNLPNVAYMNLLNYEFTYEIMEWIMEYSDFY